MKKILAVFGMVLCMASTLLADMRERDFDFSVIATATGTVSYVLRGELQGIYIDVAAGSTQTVTVETDEQTLYTKAGVAADVWVPLLYPTYGSTGSALTFASYGGTINITTNTIEGYDGTDPTSSTILTYYSTATSNPIYSKAALAGTVTVTVTGAAGTTATNASTITVVYDQ